MLVKQPPHAMILLFLFFLIWFALQTLLSLPLIFVILPQVLNQAMVITPEGAGALTPETVESLLPALAPGRWAALLFTTVSLLATVGAVVSVRVLAAGPRLLDLGLRPRAGWLGQLALGLAIGPLMFLFILALEVLAGWAQVGPGSIGTGAFVAAFFTFVMVAVSEEILARGFVLQVLEQRYGTGIAIIGSSAIFSLLHSFNPSAGIAALIGLFAAGLLFAYAYLVTRQLWLPIGLHLSWNFSEGPIFGFPVSGLPGNGLLEVAVNGPALATGGAFGPEAGLVGLAGVGVAAGIIAWWRRATPRAPDGVESLDRASEPSSVSSDGPR